MHLHVTNCTGRVTPRCVWHIYVRLGRTRDTDRGTSCSVPSPAGAKRNATRPSRANPHIE